jgi:DNA-binding beta-propeller fold protein YncE
MDGEGTFPHAAVIAPLGQSTGRGNKHMHHRIVLRMGLVALSLGAMTALSPAADAQILISANDGKGVLINGVNTVPEKPEPDNVTIYDLSSTPPKLLAEIMMPTSLVGPPSSVAIAADKSIALVSAATKLDPTNARKTAPENKLSVIDLEAKPPAVIATLETGAGASGVAINRAKTLALVANRVEGTVSVFTISGKTLAAAGKVELGDPKSGPSAVAFTPDGKAALVTRDGDHKITVLSIDGSKVELAKRDMYAGLKPYPLEISRNGAFAAISSVGMGQGDSDTISLIDLSATPYRVVDTVAVGQTPETISISPDSQFVAVNVMNGTNKPPGSPFLNAKGYVAIYAAKSGKLAKVAQADVGRWCQGIAWRGDSKFVVVQCMVEQEIQMFDFDGTSLKPAGAIKVKGGPGGIGTSPD